MAKKTKKEKSLIDELIEFKFGEGAGNDPKKTDDITEYLGALYYEISELNDFDVDDDEESNKHHSPQQFDKEMISSINSESVEDGMIPFIVVRKEKTTIDIKCPHCGNTDDKVFLSKFRSSQYDEYECPKCKKNSLVKLDFKPSLKVYIEG